MFSYSESRILLLDLGQVLQFQDFFTLVVTSSASEVLGCGRSVQSAP